ncbi:hypothetical protein B0H15DRAFT_820563 [Mycena belliarum]|uniref:Uncharacterized protein n=1 Tax=Mycena belliarum TaxID=1033014 RepID=A0AAD6XZN6_9AGAR|nr:hypothetical protein B0H15DRAFT_820563 [Mycena belliae]
MSLVALPADVHYELFLCLPDFHALNALLLTSRLFYRVFQPRRALILKSVAENLLGIVLGDELIGISAEPDPESNNLSATIKFLFDSRHAIHALEPIVFRVLVQPDTHWDEPKRCPSVTESQRLRRAAYRFARFCALSNEKQQSDFLGCLPTNEVFELVHLVDGLRKIVVSLLDDSDDSGEEYDYGSNGACVSRIVSTGPANIWRLWNSRSSSGFRAMLDQASGLGTDEDDDRDGAFDDAFHHFELSRNLSAFDATRTRALLDVGHHQTQEVLAQLERLMEPPPPPPKRFRPKFRSLQLPRCDSSPTKSTRLPFLPGHINSLPIRSQIPYFTLVLNGEPRIMPLSARQLAEVVDISTLHL